LFNAFRLKLPVLVGAGLLSLVFATGALAQTPPQPPPPPSLSWWEGCLQGGQQNCAQTPSAYSFTSCQQYLSTPNCPSPSANGVPWWAMCQQYPGTTNNCPALSATGAPWWLGCQQNPGNGSCSAGVPAGYVPCELDNIPVLIPIGNACSAIGAVGT
jgi:hypothetical protein